MDTRNPIVTAAGFLASAFAAFAFLGCKGGSRDVDRRPAHGGTSMGIQVNSTAFAAGRRVPQKYTGDGEDVSPPLTWSGLPAGTKELALIVDDPDAPTAEPWVHWVVYKIRPDATGLPENMPKDQPAVASAHGAVQGKNTWGNTGYGGPAPPKGHGVHHYRFKLYALDQPLNVQPGSDKKALLAAMKGHVLGEGELVGTYERK